MAFVVNVSAFDAGVGERGVQVIAFASGKNHSFGEDADRGPAGDAARFAHFGDSAFNHRPLRNHGLAIDYDRLRDAAAERIANFVAEGGKRGIEANHQRGPCGDRSRRWWRWDRNAHSSGRRGQIGLRNRVGLGGKQGGEQ